MAKCFKCSTKEATTRKLPWMHGCVGGYVHGQGTFEIELCDKCNNTRNTDSIGRVWGSDWYFAYYYLMGRQYMNEMNETHWKCYHCDSTKQVKLRDFPWTVRARSRDGGGVICETNMCVYLCQECWSIVHTEHASGWDESDAWDWISFKLDDAGRSKYDTVNKNVDGILTVVPNVKTEEQKRIATQPE